MSAAALNTPPIAAPPGRAELAVAIADTLTRRRDELAAAWARPEGTRTRHVAVDGLLPETTAAAIADAFGRGAD